MVVFLGAPTVALAQIEDPSNEDIESVQQLLIEHDYAIDAADGLLTRQTINAIRQFQRDHDLEIHPYLDVKAIDAIKTVLQPPPDTTPLAFELSLAPSSLEQDYHALTNEELLTQTTTRYRKAEQRLHAEQRHLQKLRILYRQIEQANASWHPSRMAESASPAADIEAETGTAPEGQDETSIAQAERRLENHQGHLLDIERQIEVLEQRMKQNEAVQQASEGFIDTLRALHAMVLEIRLRVADGSLPQTDIPADLTEDAFRQQRQQLQARQQTLLETQQQNRTQLQRLQTQLEDIQAFVSDAETGLAAMRDRQEQSSQRQRLQQAYGDKAPGALRQELARLEEERVSLQGSFQLSLLHFDRSLTQLAGLEAALQPLPDEETLAAFEQNVSIDQAQEATDAFKAAIAAFETRLAELQGFAQQLAEVSDWGRNLETEAGILREHLAKMRLLSELIVARDGSPGTGFDPDSIAQHQASLTNTIDSTTGILQQSQQQTEQLQARLEEIRAAHLRARQRLVDIEQTLASAQQAQAWQQELTELDSEALVARFVSDADALQAQRASLDEQRQVIDGLVEQQQELRDRLNLFSDPLIEMSQSAVQDEKQRIEETLYKLSGLEAPAQSQPGGDQTAIQPDSAAAETANAPEETKAPQSEATSQNAASTDQSARREPLSADVEGLKAYRNLIATRLQSGQSRQQDREQLLEILRTLEKAQSEYIDQLTEAHQRLLQQYATAVELKKQLGRGDLAPEQAPEGLIEALDKGPIDALEQDIAIRSNHRAHVRLLIANLQAEDPARPQRQALIETLQFLVGQRLDLLADLQRLEQQRLQQPEALSEGERQRLDQQAEHRLRAGSGWLETMLGFLPSERAAELTELLRNHYRELVVAEDKQALLDTEKDKLTS